MEAAATSPKRRKRRTPLLIAALVLACTGAFGGIGVWSAYTGKADNSGNAVSSGTVSISDNGGGSTAMLGFSSALPGASDTSCIKVTYGGSLPSAVRLYGTTSGSGLAQYLTVRITRGSYSAPEPSFDSCTNFAEDSTDYIGQGAGVIYEGTLEAFPDTWASGLVDPRAASPESWTNAESHVYKIQATLQDNTAAEGKNATQSFTWEARSN